MTTDMVRRDALPAVRQMMERFFDDPFFREPLARWPLGSEDGGLPLDVREQNGKLLVEANLPGFTKADIDVQVHEGVLSIRAQHSEEHEERDAKYYRRERSWGAVSRRLALPGVVDETSVDAELKNGVLTLTIPLPEKPSPRQIDIKGE